MAEYDKSLEHASKSQLTRKKNKVMSCYNDSYFDCDENVPKSKLIGKYAYITDKDSSFYQEWGEVIDFNNGVYHIIMDTDKETVITFNRVQFKIPERQWLRYHADEIKYRNAIV